MRWTNIDTSCKGEPISPVPAKPSSGDLAVPIEVEVETQPNVG